MEAKLATVRRAAHLLMDAGLTARATAIALEHGLMCVASDQTNLLEALIQTARDLRDGTYDRVRVDFRPPEAKP